MFLVPQKQLNKLNELPGLFPAQLIVSSREPTQATSGKRFSSRHTVPWRVEPGRGRDRSPGSVSAPGMRVSSPVGVLGLARWGWHLEKVWKWLGGPVPCIPCSAAHPEGLLAGASPTSAQRPCSLALGLRTGVAPGAELWARGLVAGPQPPSRGCPPACLVFCLHV